ncbi:unnamed protein product [Prunus armeniaca]
MDTCCLRHLPSVEDLPIALLGQPRLSGRVAVPQLMSRVPHRNPKQVARLPRPIKEDNHPSLEIAHPTEDIRYRRDKITKLRGKVPNHFSASTVWRRLWENDKINLQFLKTKQMGTTSGPQFLSEDGLPYGMPSGASPALHPSTPFGNPPALQTTVEAELLAQMTSLWKEMTKLQERNNLLSSKVDETQRLLNQQETQNVQTTESSQSQQTPGRQKKGKQGAKATPAPSKQLVVPPPQDQPHVLKKVYTDCRHRINDKKDAERHRSPIRINARLRDSRMRVLGDKSPIRRVQGLDSALESDDEYVPTRGNELSYRSEAPPEYSKARTPSPRRASEDFSSEGVPSRDPVIRLLFQRIQKMEDDRTQS